MDLHNLLNGCSYIERSGLCSLSLSCNFVWHHYDFVCFYAHSLLLVLFTCYVDAIFDVVLGMFYLCRFISLYMEAASI